MGEQKMLRHLIDICHSKHLESLRLHRFVSSDRFCLIYSKATKEQLAMIKETFTLRDFESWFELVSADILEFKSVHDLRHIASSLKIPNYFLMDKETLIEKVRVARQTQRTASISGDS